MLNSFYPFGRYHLTTRRYYTLEDFYVGMKGESAANGPFTPATNKFWLKDIGIKLYGPDFNYTDGDSTSLYSGEVGKLFNDYIFPKYWDCFITYSDEVDVENAAAMTGDEFKQLFEMFASKLIAWVRETLPAYKKEIEVYASIENDLLKQLGSSTTTKFNDTPQVNGDVSTDPYITNLTTTESKTDSGTPLEKLKEVRNSIRNVYEAWSKEFNKFVIYM